MYRFVLLLGFCTLLGGQADVPREVLLLARIKEKMALNLARLPNYTCLQTMERSERRAPSKRFRLVDTLRLEVALVEGKEMFSWPGAREFQESELREIVPTGAIGNGMFGLHARSVFLSSYPAFRHRGEETLDGERYVRYDYTVSQISSGYKLRVGAAEAVVGYRGSFWADPDTLDLHRLDVIAEEIPPHIPLRSAVVWMEYARVDIGSGDYLLPRRAVMTLTGLDGGLSRNEIRFSECRQYTGESFLSFAEPPPMERPAEAEAPKEFRLPAGLSLDLALETPIQEGESMVGDAVLAEVRSRSKKDGRVVVPKGALVRGRLVHLERMGGRVPYYTVALRFETIEFDGRRAPFTAELYALPSFLDLPGRPVMEPDFPGASIVVDSPIENGPGLAVFYAQTDTIRIPAGMRMRWRTIAPRHLQ